MLLVYLCKGERNAKKLFAILMMAAVILLTPANAFASGGGNGTGGGKGEALFVKSATIEDAVFQLPVGLSRWAHPGSLESPLAALHVASALYPGYFPDIDMTEEIRDFYDAFFHIELTDEEIGRILKGEGIRDARKDEK